jgi:hypothetical protein
MTLYRRDGSPFLSSVHTFPVFESSATGDLCPSVNLSPDGAMSIAAPTSQMDSKYPIEESNGENREASNVVHNPLAAASEPHVDTTQSNIAGKLRYSLQNYSDNYVDMSTTNLLDKGSNATEKIEISQQAMQRNHLKVAYVVLQCSVIQDLRY